MTPDAVPPAAWAPGVVAGTLGTAAVVPGAGAELTAKKETAKTAVVCLAECTPSLLSRVKTLHSQALSKILAYSK